MNSFLNKRDSRFVLFGLSAEKTSWRGVGLLAFVFVGSLIFAALLTPPAYWLVEYWHNQTNSANAQWLLSKGVDVYFDRLRMGAIVLGLPWLMSACHLWSWRGLGLAGDKNGVLAFTKSWIFGLVLIVGLALWQKTTVNASDGGVTVARALDALLAGLILGFLEETIFRGLILRIFYTGARRPWLALVLTSAFFAYTHFKVPTSVWQNIAPGVHGDTGFFVGYWTTFGIVVDFDWAQFITLWLLGMVLGCVTLRTGSLLPAIGFHAGLVSAMFFFRGNHLADTWPAAAILGAMLLLLMLTPSCGEQSPSMKI